MKKRYKDLIALVAFLLLILIITIMIETNGNLDGFITRLRYSRNGHNEEFIEEIRSNFPCIRNPEIFEPARVIKIIDGDSIQVLMNENLYEVRYIGIDAPEFSGEEWLDAQEAKLANRILVEGKEIILYKDKSDTDRFGRLLRYVFVDQKFVNHELVKEGYAISKFYYPDVMCQELFESASLDR